MGDGGRSYSRLMGAIVWILATGGPDPERAAEATRQWAALLLGILLLAIVLVVLLVLLMLAKRHWGPGGEPGGDRSKKKAVIADAWAEAGRRVATPGATDEPDGEDGEPEDGEAGEERG